MTITGSSGTAPSASDGADLEVLGNARLVTFDPDLPYLEDGAVAFAAGRIASVGTTSELRRMYPGAAFRDLSRMTLLPGLINLHTHMYGSLARGMALKDPPPANFVQILERLWWRLDRSLDSETIRASAMVGLLDAVMTGCTTLFDHHASPHAIEGSLDILEDCFREVGLRGCFCYEVSDRDGEEIALQGIRENARYCAKPKDEQFAAAFGIHASFTVSDETLDAVAAELPSSATGVHVHVAEDAADVSKSRELWGADPVSRLAERHLLGERSLLAHGVHLVEEDWQRLAATRTTLVHNPCSNLNNAVGTARIEQLLAAGVTVALGTDGYTSSMLDEYATAGIVARHMERSPGAGWVSSLAMLTQTNPAVASRFFTTPVGRLEEGHAADAVALDYHPPTPMDASNLGGHLLFGLARAPVASVWCRGREVVRDGEPTQVDRREVFARTREAARKLWERF